MSITISSRQSAPQPSQRVALESSHCSGASTVPSPQLKSIWQSTEQSGSPSQTSPVA